MDALDTKKVTHARPTTWDAAGRIGSTQREFFEHMDTPLTFDRLTNSDVSEAAGLLGLAMRDNPINVRVFSSDDQTRNRALTHFFRPVLCGLLKRGAILAARHEKSIVGLCAYTFPGHCQPTLFEKIAILPAVISGNGLSTVNRLVTWTNFWSRSDPRTPHFHLGPVAVHPAMHGKGIGTAMLQKFCTIVGEQSLDAYLETDKAENVTFYTKFGFRVVSEADVLGVRNWFMLSSPSASTLR